jgi:hypothetical protein
MEKKFVKEIDFPTNMGTLRVELNCELPVNPDTGDFLLTGEVIEKVNRYLLSLLAEKEGMFTSKELMFIFSVLPYTQKELALVMKKDKSTLTYYKQGVNSPDPLFCRTLQEIILDYIAGKETTMNRLRRMVQADQTEDLVTANRNKVIHIA